MVSECESEKIVRICNLRFAICALLAAWSMIAESGALADTDSNQLSDVEKKSGWKFLFDGKSLNGWRRFGKQEPPGKNWTVENGTLHLLPGGGGGDIITTNQFTDFELEWEWKLAPKANNGVKYLVSEARPNAPGLEYQMVDDATMPDDRHKTAALYFIFEPKADKPLKPIGEWNRSKIIVRGKQGEHWLNGVKVVEFELESPELKAAIAKSKFRSVADFDQKISGHIMLTDHHDEAWFRNVKIQELK